MRLLFSICVAAFFSSSVPASAQRYWGLDQVPYCAEDTAPEACREQSLGVLLTRLELPTAEGLASQGFNGVRVFQFDAFGNIWPASSIVAKPVTQYRREGMVEAVVVHADGRVARLMRPIWESGWREMDAIIDFIRQNEPVERTFEPAPSSGPPLPPTCLDPPTVIIEVISSGQVHRSWPDTCRSNDAVGRARQVPEIIAAAFPVCGHFAIERYGRGLGRLRACLSVDGDDLLSAAEVMEILRPNVGGDTRVMYEADLLSAQVRLTDIDGRQFVGQANVVDALKGGALGQRWLRVLRATGDETGVTVTAELRQIRPSNDPDPLPLSVRWVREADGVWRISEWVVAQRSAGSQPD